MAMKTVNLGDVYNRQKFVGAMKDLSDLGGLVEKISAPEGNWNPCIRADIHGLINPPVESYAGLAPDSVINDANEAHSKYEENMQNYAIKNFDILLGKISGETLLQLVTSVLPVDKTGNKGLDKVIKAINEKRKIAKAAEKGDIHSYVNEKLKDASDWRKQAYFGYSIGNPDYVQRTFQAYAQSSEQDFSKEVLDNQGNIKENVLRKIIRENYTQLVAKDTEESDKVAKRYLSAIAQGAYQAVKPEKEDKPGKIARTGKVK